VVKGLGYRIVLGSVYPHDPLMRVWWVNAWYVLSMVRPGAVVICHDRRSWTVPMLRKVLPELKRRGYRVVNLTELLREAQIQRPVDGSLGTSSMGNT
jgi:peptidoglycan/xylan/chitin deacetylase (PgdA/CDA1 family)